MGKISMFFLASIFLFSGCASMFNDDRFSLVANSPAGEDIKVEVTTSEGTYMTKLPATIVAQPSNDGVSIRVIDKCYDPSVTEVDKGITGSFWMNVFNGGVGFLIDWATGDMWDYPSYTQVITSKKAECEKIAN